jgi:hypothetical protein
VVLRIRYGALPDATNFDARIARTSELAGNQTGWLAQLLEPDDVAAGNWYISAEAGEAGCVEIYIYFFMFCVVLFFYATPFFFFCIVLFVFLIMLPLIPLTSIFIFIFHIPPQPAATRCC